MYITVLLFAILGGLIAAAVRLPPLVGFLTAGFALSAVGIEEVPGLHLGADLGVTVLLFTIGLHLNPRALLELRAIGTAVGQAVVNTVVIAVVLAGVSMLPLALFAGTGWRVWLLIGLATSFSSTVFVMNQLESTGRVRSTVGAIAISILVLQDIVAVAYLALSGDEAPQPWALALFFLPLLRPLLARMPDRVRRTELMVLGGVAAAIAGYTLFSAAGLAGDFGALIAGVMISGHPIAQRLFDALVSVKELLLVAFFIQIGLSGFPDAAGWAVVAVLLLLLPLKAAVFCLMLHMWGMSNRTSAITALTMANYSEFGLIVATVAVANDTLPQTWIPVMGVTVAASFVVSALVGVRREDLVNWIAEILPPVAEHRLAPNERPVPVSDVDALVLGMGRVGIGVYRRLADDYDLTVAGVEFNESRCAELSHRGMRVIHGDGTDPELWRRMHAVEQQPRLIVLAMPEHDANITVLDLMRKNDVPVTVAAAAHERHTTFELLDRGADAVAYLYEGAGRELADFAWEAYTQTHPESKA
ncbi:cation:proton antiporter [Corynebacterium sp. TAE3-ERU12]|uniref:cation:proton antiporter domain-containing protein n=1 Tax=Corynebacterium sp. TAE3-ERU12 TaxID=2849491 RepID=UPI00351D6FE7